MRYAYVLLITLATVFSMEHHTHLYFLGIHTHLKPCVYTCTKKAQVKMGWRTMRETSALACVASVSVE